MPSFSVDDIDIDPFDFVSSCDKNEINELIQVLINWGHIEKNQLTSQHFKHSSVLENEFIENMRELSKKYYSLSQEDEETLKNIFKKYL